MFRLSTADGFVLINENLGDMIKYVANEPSVGMYLIQQHAQNAVPNLIKLKTNIIKKSREATLHTEDNEESIAITRSMKDCGFSIIDEMIRDINTSLALVKEGMIQQQTLSTEKSESSYWARGIVSAPSNVEWGGSYFSNVLRFSKDQAENVEFVPESCHSSLSDEADKVRLCNQIDDDDKVVGYTHVLRASNEYDEFKADREVRLEEWLKDSA